MNQTNRPSFLVKMSLAVSLYVFSLLGVQAQAQESTGRPRITEPTVRTVVPSLSDQVQALQQRVADLEIRIKDRGVDPAAMAANGNQHRMQMSMGRPLPAQSAMLTGNVPAVAPAPTPDMMSGMMDMMRQMMGGTSGGAPMGQLSGAIGGVLLSSALPGFPGVSHLYHIGGTNFFLDHPQHLALSLEQQLGLSMIRSTAVLSRSDYARRIQEAEEQLWVLTAADIPDLAAVEAKIREIEKLRSDSRLTYIKSVGRAATLLTAAQRQALIGQAAQLPTGDAANPAGDM